MAAVLYCVFFFFSSRRRHTRCSRDWSSDVCSSDLDDFTIIRYESLRESPADSFRLLLGVLGETTPDMLTFQAALDFSQFDNMQKLEEIGRASCRERVWI